MGGKIFFGVGVPDRVKTLIRQENEQYPYCGGAMLAQVMADKAQCFHQVIFHGMAGKLQLHGYFFMVESLVTAQLEYQAALGRELGHGVPDQGIVFGDQGAFFHIIILRRCQSLEFMEQFHVMGGLAEVIEGLIAGDGEDIAFQVVHLVEDVPAKPEFDEYFLGDLFSDVFRVSDSQNIAV